MLIPSLSMASGKVVVEPTYNNTSQESGIKVGLSVWQKLFKTPIFFSGYAGHGTDPEEGFSSGERWYSFKTGLGIQVGDRFQVEAGHQWNNNVNWSGKEDITYMRGSYQLW